MKGIAGLIRAVMSLYQSPITRVRVETKWPGVGIQRGSVSPFIVQCYV